MKKIKEFFKRLFTRQIEIDLKNAQEVDFEGNPRQALVFKVPSYVSIPKIMEKLEEQLDRQISSEEKIPKENLKSLLVMHKDIEIENIDKESLEYALEKMGENGDE